MVATRKVGNNSGTAVYQSIHCFLQIMQENGSGPKKLHDYFEKYITYFSYCNLQGSSIKLTDSVITIAKEFLGTITFSKSEKKCSKIGPYIIEIVTVLTLLEYLYSFLL